jgi:hypothetical protein
MVGACWNASFALSETIMADIVRKEIESVYERNRTWRENAEALYRNEAKALSAKM